MVGNGLGVEAGLGVVDGVESLVGAGAGVAWCAEALGDTVAVAAAFAGGRRPIWVPATDQRQHDHDRCATREWSTPYGQDGSAKGGMGSRLAGLDHITGAGAAGAQLDQALPGLFWHSPSP